MTPSSDQDKQLSDQDRQPSDIRDKNRTKPVVDADVHLSPDADGTTRIGMEEVLRRMDKSGVDRALIWLQPPYLRHVEPLNQYIFQAVTAHPDRFTGFGWVDPHLGQERCLNEIDRCLDDYGFAGIKLNGAQNDFRIDDQEMSLPLVEKIASKGGVLALHVGADAYENTHPYRAGNIAARYPELRILMVHMGGASFSDLSFAAIETAMKYKNITMIGSAVRTGAILKAIRMLGADRICFGSDTPFESMQVEIAKYNAMLQDEVTPEEKDRIMGGNILSILKLRSN